MLQTLGTNALPAIRDALRQHTPKPVALLYDGLDWAGLGHRRLKAGFVNRAVGDAEGDVAPQRVIQQIDVLRHVADLPLPGALAWTAFGVGFFMLGATPLGFLLMARLGIGAKAQRLVGFFLDSSSISSAAFSRILFSSEATDLSPDCHGSVV